MRRIKGGGRAAKTMKKRNSKREKEKEKEKNVSALLFSFLFALSHIHNTHTRTHTHNLFQRAKGAVWRICAISPKEREFERRFPSLFCHLFSLFLFSLVSCPSLSTYTHTHTNDTRTHTHKPLLLSLLHHLSLSHAHFSTFVICFVW